MLQLRLLCGCAALALCCQPALADTEADTGFLRTLGEGYRGLWSRDSAVLLGVGAGASLAMLENDYQTTDFARAIDASSLESGVDFGEFYGSGLTIGAGAGSMMLLGEMGHERIGAAGRDIMASFVVASSITWGLKLGVGRERPLGGPYAFPSGHTAAAFATVPAAYKHGGRWWGLAATTLALGTAASRIEEQRHYASDVIFGAAIGLASGNATIGFEIPWMNVWQRLLVTHKQVGVKFKF